MKPFKITKKEKAPESTFIIEGEITVKALEEERGAALEKYQGILSLDGFRKGHIPEKMIIEKVGEVAITEEQASLAIEKNYPEFIKDAGIFPIGQPKVSILKISPGQPVEFKIETAIIPEVELPNYKKISKDILSKEEEITVTDQDLEDSIKEIRTSVAHHKFHLDHGNTDHHDHDFKEEDLPPLDEELMSKIGKFESVEDFKNKLKESLLTEKKSRAKEKKRLEVIEAIIKDTKSEVPKVLIESELIKMIAQLKDSVASMGAEYSAYLKSISKTEDELKIEWKDEAKKRALIQIVLNEISEKEGIKVDEKDLNHQTAQLSSMYKDADPLRIRIYVETMMLNEKVWNFLDSQKG